MRVIFLSVIIAGMLFPGCNRNGKYTDDGATDYTRKADSVLERMTLEEKTGQLVLYSSSGDITGPIMDDAYEQYVKEASCGNIFNAHSASYNRRLQEIAVNETRMGIPLLFGYDVIHGYKTIFPISLGEAATWDTAMIRKASRIAAVEATAAGVNWTFAPMVDISVDPRWGRVSESAGEDPFLGSAIARARVHGFQGDNLEEHNTLLACVKHFAAYGAPKAGRDYHTVDMSDRLLRDVYLPPYRAAVDAGVGSVMTSFNELHGVPASASKYLMTDILRDEWGFDGFIVTDYTAVMELMPHGVAGTEQQAVELAMDAGVNMDMQSGFYHEHLVSLVEKEIISEKQVDDRVREVLEAKFKLGLFEDPFRYTDTVREANEIYTEEHLAYAREVARHSLVLLKNENDVLPLEKGTDLALIGPHGDTRHDLLGSWYAAGDWTGITNLEEAIGQANAPGRVKYQKGCDFDGEDRSGFAAALQAARSADAVVMLMGERGGWTGEAASRTTIELPGIQKELIREVASLGKPVVLVLLNGRPLALEDEVGLVDGMLEAWFPGSAGARAVADVLFGAHNPSGKLTMTFPRVTGQIPIHYNMKNTGRPVDPSNPDYKFKSRYIDTPNDPLFPFGFGLSYTTFDYSDLRLSAGQIGMEDSLEVTVTVTNSGERSGHEVVQLYTRDLVGSVTRPVKELKGFRKIYLEAGDSLDVRFTLDAEDLSFYRKDMTFGPEPGDFMVFVGGDSETVLEDQFTIHQ